MKNVKFNAHSGTMPRWEVEIEFKSDITEDEDAVAEFLVQHWDDVIEFEDEDIWFSVGGEEVRILSYEETTHLECECLQDWALVEAKTQGDGLRDLANLAEEQGLAPEELLGVGPNYAKMIRKAAGMPPLESVN